MLDAEKKYQAVQNRLASGWNTWDTRSVTSHVLLPEGVAVMLGFREFSRSRVLRNPLVAPSSGSLEVRPGLRTRNGSYTDLQIQWQGVTFRVQSAHDPEDPDSLLLQVEVVEGEPILPPALIVEFSLLWQRPGYTCLEDGVLTAHLPERVVKVHHTEEDTGELWTEAVGAHQVLSLASPVLMRIGGNGETVGLSGKITEQRHRCLNDLHRFGEEAELVEGLQCGLFWNTIYEPVHQRVCTPVSRRWSCKGGGYSLFCWDTYFAAFMALLTDPDLALANLVEMTREAEGLGFVPNCAHRTFSSRDRSQPPVGAMILREFLRKTGETWVADLLFDPLFTWNSWWLEERSTGDDLCWGSNAYEPVAGNPWETNGVHDGFGAALESGLDNSPMYDEIPFEAGRNQLALADVGLMSMFIVDCEALSDLAGMMGRKDQQQVLTERASRTRKRLATMWEDERGVFLNRRTDTGEFSSRISPTLLYAMMSGVVTEEQQTRMVDGILFHPEKLGGDWLLPSISRDDPAFPEQDYWRGRIWAPMNFLVYLGLRRVGAVEAQKRLAEHSRDLFLKEWREHRHIYENYCALTGVGGNVKNADPFYHWGALLAATFLMESGHYDPLFPQRGSRLNV